MDTKRACRGEDGEEANVAVDEEEEKEAATPIMQSTQQNSDRNAMPLPPHIFSIDEGFNVDFHSQVF